MKTDTQIGESQEKGGQRELTKASDIMPFDKTLSLEDDGKKYNQFAGKKTTYNEEDYTTKIDQSKITPEQRLQAQTLEDEIKNRGHKQEVDLGHDDNDEQIAMQEDEEMKFSGVIRDEEPEAKPTNLKSRQEYIHDYLKQGKVRKQEWKMEIINIVQSSNVNVVPKKKEDEKQQKGKKEGKQQQKGARPSKFKLGEIKRVSKEEEQKQVTAMQTENFFDSWGGKIDLEPKNSLVKDNNDSSNKSSAAPFTPAAIDQTAQQKAVGLNTSAIAFNPKAKPFVPGQSKS